MITSDYYYLTISICLLITSLESVACGGEDAVLQSIALAFEICVFAFAPAPFNFA